MILTERLHTIATSWASSSILGISRFTRRSRVTGYAIHLQCALKFVADREHRKQSEHLDAYIAVSNIRSLFSELTRRSAQVLRPLEARPWGCLDFYVEDPDGYIL